MTELTKKLQQHNNFHLSFKVIQTTSVEIANKLLKDINKKAIFLTGDNVFETLKKAYEEKIEIIICDESLIDLLPLCVILSNDNVSLIKPYIPTIYIQKDNRIIQKIKTVANKKMSSLIKASNYQEVLEFIKLQLSLK